jgi:hypothetical protein
VAQDAHVPNPLIVTFYPLFIILDAAQSIIIIDIRTALFRKWL